MAIKIKSISNLLQDTGLKILVHGPAGAGKTVLCATAGVKTLIISAEGGLLSIRNAPKYVKGVEVKTLAEIQEVYDLLLEGNEDGEPICDWIALDSITEIAETVLAYEKANNKDPRAAYGNLQDEMIKWMKKFRDLPKYNVIMTCKQQLIDDEGMKIRVPMMPGTKLHQQIPYLFDEVFALRVEKDEDKEDYRILQTNRDVKYEAKDRSGALEMFEKPSLKHIYKKIKESDEKAEGQRPVDLLPSEASDDIPM